MSRLLRVLLACECSGRVRDEFAKRGWEACSADLLPSETPVRVAVRAQGAPAVGPPSPELKFHYQGDVRDLFDPDHPVNASRKRENMPRIFTPQLPIWDLVIAFPPCTRLSWAGNRWRREWRENGEEDAAAAFFTEMIQAPSPFVAVENPRGVMIHRYRLPDQEIQPWWFGDSYEKRTCLWLKGLPRLVADDPVEPVGRVATGGGSWKTDKAAGRKAMSALEDSEGRRNRARVRSRTFPGVARAMAAQWGAHVEARMPGGARDEAEQ